MCHLQFAARDTGFGLKDHFVGASISVGVLSKAHTQGLDILVRKQVVDHQKTISVV